VKTGKERGLEVGSGERCGVGSTRRRIEVGTDTSANLVKTWSMTSGVEGGSQGGLDSARTTVVISEDMSMAGHSGRDSAGGSGTERRRRKQHC
jgi:hypothetical protein